MDISHSGLDLRGLIEKLQRVCYPAEDTLAYRYKSIQARAFSSYQRKRELFRAINLFLG